MTYDTAKQLCQIVCDEVNVKEYAIRIGTADQEPIHLVYDSVEKDFFLLHGTVRTAPSPALRDKIPGILSQVFKTSQ